MLCVTSVQPNTGTLSPHQCKRNWDKKIHKGMGKYVVSEDLFFFINKISLKKFMKKLKRLFFVS